MTRRSTGPGRGGWTGVISPAGPLIAWLIRLATEIVRGHEPQADRLVDAGGSAAGRSARGIDRLGRLSPGVADDRLSSAGDGCGLAPAGDPGLGDRRRGDHERHASGLLLGLGGRLDVPGHAFRHDTRAWIAAGLIGALGVWAKYSFLAFPASVGLFLLLSPAHRRQLRRPGFWVMSLLCVGLGLAPIVIWNATHGWAGASQLGRPGRPLVAGNLGEHLAGRSPSSAATPPRWEGSGGSRESRPSLAH